MFTLAYNRNALEISTLLFDFFPVKSKAKPAEDLQWREDLSGSTSSTSSSQAGINAWLTAYLRSTFDALVTRKPLSNRKQWTFYKIDNTQILINNKPNKWPYHTLTYYYIIKILFYFLTLLKIHNCDLLRLKYCTCVMCIWYAPYNDTQIHHIIEYTRIISIISSMWNRVTLHDFQKIINQNKSEIWYFYPFHQ